MPAQQTDPVFRALERRLVEHASIIAATDAQRESAAISRDHLRELLNTGHMEKRLLDDFLIGSYARFTALTPLDDVDMVFVIEQGYWQDRLERALGQRPPPAKVLETFATAARRRYPATSVRVQRRSVGLLLSKLTIDIVPAIVDRSRPKWLFIPDREKKSWISSAPQIHTEVSTAVNKRNGNKLKPLIRLLKSWNHGLPSTAQLKSFAIETIATLLFDRVRIPTLFEGLELFFDFLCWRTSQKPTRSWSDAAGVNISWWSREVPDLGGTGSNLLQHVDWERAKAFASAVHATREALTKARRARSGDNAWGYLEGRF
jgi:hypothetical protein